MLFWGQVGHAKNGSWATACWKGQFGKQHNTEIWKAIPSRILWNIWKEGNVHIFYWNELSIVTLKLVFSRVLYDGTMATSSLLSINFLELFDLLNFRGCLENLGTGLDISSTKNITSSNLKWFYFISGFSKRRLEPILVEYECANFKPSCLWKYRCKNTKHKSVNIKYISGPI